MLIPIFLPFNLLKSGINMAVTILIYKPIVTALRKAGLVEVSNKKIEKNQTIGIMLIGIVLLATCIFFVLVVKGIL